MRALYLGGCTRYEHPMLGTPLTCKWCSYKDMRLVRLLWCLCTHKHTHAHTGTYTHTYTHIDIGTHTDLSHIPAVPPVTFSLTTISRSTTLMSFLSNTSIHTEELAGGSPGLASSKSRRLGTTSRFTPRQRVNQQILLNFRVGQQAVSTVILSGKKPRSFKVSTEFFDGVKLAIDLHF